MKLILMVRLICVNRRIGGLENYIQECITHQNVNRRIGGLEIIGLLQHLPGDC